ncbi:hypothetical protein SeKA_A1352 [Salmonella enterica subsp. enterica serovar Kentucky str. CVM29188]|nr:hypothetical protein SeKA_A1352 [Salmonella enterica subsp. enterica serovar Kentucky str. CVM29188]
MKNKDNILYLNEINLHTVRYFTVANQNLQQSGLLCLTSAALAPPSVA